VTSYADLRSCVSARLSLDGSEVGAVPACTASETGRTAFWVSTNDQVNPNPAFSEILEALGSQPTSTKTLRQDPGVSP
jgi:hypothetical protein